MILKRYLSLFQKGMCLKRGYKIILHRKSDNLQYVCLFSPIFDISELYICFYIGKNHHIPREWLSDFPRFSQISFLSLDFSQEVCYNASPYKNLQYNFHKQISTSTKETTYDFSKNTTIEIFMPPNIIPCI